METFEVVSMPVRIANMSPSRSCESSTDADARSPRPPGDRQQGELVVPLDEVGANRSSTSMTRHGSTISR